MGINSINVNNSTVTSVDEEIIYNSKNLINSGAVYDSIKNIIHNAEYQIIGLHQQFWITGFAEYNKTYKITNKGDGDIAVAYYAQDKTTQTQTSKLINPNASEIFKITNANSYYLLMYASTATSGNIIVEDENTIVRELDRRTTVLENDVEDILLDLNEFDDIFKTYVKKAAYHKSFWLNLPVVAGVKYCIENKTDGDIGIATYEQDQTTQKEQWGLLGTNSKKYYIAAYDAYYLLIYCATASEGDIIVTDMSSYLGKIESLEDEMSELIEYTTYDIFYHTTKQIPIYNKRSHKILFKNNTDGIVNIGFYDQSVTTPTQTSHALQINETYTAVIAEETYYLLLYGSSATEGTVYVEDRSKRIPTIEDQLSIISGEIFAYLPDDIYCAVGKTIEIYNDLVCLNSKKYHVRWTCDAGHPMNDKFNVTGLQDLVGDHAISFTLLNDNNEVLYSKSSTLHIVEDHLPNFTLVTLGDSNSCGKYWQYDLTQLSNNKITLVGARTYHMTYEGSSVSFLVDGRGGFSTYYYLQGHETSSDYSDSGPETPHHKLYNPTTERFDWNYYVTNSLNGVSPDCIVIMLGTNEFSRSTEAFLNDYKQLVDYIQEDDQNLKIFILPCIFSGLQDGIGFQGNVQGYSRLPWTYQYLQDKAVWNMNKGLHETFKNYNNVYFAETAITFDRWNNYWVQPMPVNPRSTKTEYVQKESIHPNNDGPGYGQLSDIIYSTFCGILSV